MATRKRLGGTSTGVTVRPVYEDFKPVTEWKREEGSDTYLVYLPGEFDSKVYFLNISTSR